ncbi:MAG: hypothetical protein JW723_07350 [Bacteroidales bacterium]|nr:hypothetical protein [Bacteroidales bacterium]
MRTPRTFFLRHLYMLLTVIFFSLARPCRIYSQEVIIADHNVVGHLFDYADILTHNNAGEKYDYGSWNGHPVDYIHTGNGIDYDEGNGACHTGEEGCLKPGKVMWWLLARIAGWDGGEVPVEKVDIDQNIQIGQNLTSGLYHVIVRKPENKDMVSYSKIIKL